MKAIIDTNVLIAANGRDCPQVTPKCQLKTVQYLKKIIENGIIVVDSDWAKFYEALTIYRISIEFLCCEIVSPQTTQAQVPPPL